MLDYRVISSDNHIVEPADLWTSRAESKFKDRLPRVERLEDGEWWFCDGQQITLAAGPGASAGERFEEPENLRLNRSMEEVRLGGYIPEEHVKDMDIDGIDLSIVYPSTIHSLFSVPDSE